MQSLPLALLALLALLVPGAELARADPGSTVCPCPAPRAQPEPRRLALRGGGLAEEQSERERKLAAALDKLRGITTQLQDAANADEDQVLASPRVALRRPAGAWGLGLPAVQRPARPPRARRPGVLLQRLLSIWRDRVVSNGQDVIGYTSWGQPLSRDPVNAVVYNPDELSDDSQLEAEEERDAGRYAPTPEGIASAMEKVDWIRDVVDRLSPENVNAGPPRCFAVFWAPPQLTSSSPSLTPLPWLSPALRGPGTRAHAPSFPAPLRFGAGLEKMGMKLEDFQPSMNPMGTEMGNLTRIMEVGLMCCVFMRVQGVKL